MPVTRRGKVYFPSVLPSGRMNAAISETIKDAILGLGMQILEIPAQRNFVCHAHSTPTNPKNCGYYSFSARIKMLAKMYCSVQICHNHSNAHNFHGRKEILTEMD